jgi:biopolymer transport protein ExbB
MDNTTLWLQYAEEAIDYGVMGILIVMSIISLWLFIERLMYYKAVRYEEYENKDQLELDLSDHLGTIAAIGSNAPYVGLLGTVLGIMVTFYTLGDTGAVDTKQIMTGLALALKATAMGLVVAIPAIVFYTVLMRKAERIATLWDIHNQPKG